MSRVELHEGVTVVPNDVVEFAYSGKLLGNVDHRFPADDVATNRNALLRAVGIGRYTVQACQLKAEFIDLSDIPTEEIAPEYKTDGMFIDRADVVLGLNPADCPSFALFDTRDPNVIGLIHAGRQGVAGDIHIAALEHITSAYGVPKEDIGILFAPAIHQESYFFSHLPPEQLADIKRKGFIDFRGDRHYVNLLGRIVRDLLDEGLEPDQLDTSPIDTGANAAYFSHVRSVRTGETEGRNGVVAKLKST